MRWHKSSLSRMTCVEVSQNPQLNAVWVRNSTFPAGPSLLFTTAEWAAFIQGAKAGEFDPDPICTCGHTVAAHDSGSCGLCTCLSPKSPPKAQQSNPKAA